jgi:steroid delta-isomerase-like uncharacterized protein
MPRRIVSVSAVLLAVLAAAIALPPGRGGPAAARQTPPAAGTPCPTTTPAENEALVRRVYEEAWGRGDLAVVDEVLADDYVNHLPRLARTSAAAPRGPAAVAENTRRFRTDFPDLRVTVEALVAEGDTVAVRMTFAGTQRDPLDAIGAPATGRRMERAVWAFARVACGKIAEEWLLPDNLTMLRQLGIVTDEELDDAGTPTVATPAP